MKYHNNGHFTVQEIPDYTFLIKLSITVARKERARLQHG